MVKWQHSDYGKIHQQSEGKDAYNNHIEPNLQLIQTIDIFLHKRELYSADKYPNIARHLFKGNMLSPCGSHQ